MRAGFLSHVDLTVSDLDRSVAFYDRVLTRIGYRRSPLPPLSSPPTWFIFGTKRYFYSMSLCPTEPDHAHKRFDWHTPGYNHIAFHVPSRRHVEDVYTFLCTMDARILRAPAEYPYTPGYYAVFFADPDGMKLEVVYEPAQGAVLDVCPACAKATAQQAEECAQCGLSFAPAVE